MSSILYNEGDLHSSHNASFNISVFCFKIFSKLDTYKSIWYKTIDSIKLAEKTGDEDQRTEAALRKIANTIKKYCKNNGDFWEASKKLPKVLRESKKVQKLLGTLFRNINRIADHASTVQSIEKVTKKTTTVAVQQTFPGWEDITIN